jgi:hypothetical protein
MIARQFLFERHCRGYPEKEQRRWGSDACAQRHFLSSDVNFFKNRHFAWPVGRCRLTKKNDRSIVRAGKGKALKFKIICTEIIQIPRVMQITIVLVEIDAELHATADEGENVIISRKSWMLSSKVKFVLLCNFVLDTESGAFNCFRMPIFTGATSLRSFTRSSWRTVKINGGF